MYVKQQLRTLVSMAQTAVRKPSKVPPYIKTKAKQSRGIAAIPATWRRTATLPRQSTRLEQLRECDEWLLIVLDAARYDVLSARAEPLIRDDVTAVRSMAHDTFQWLQRAWPGQHDVTYVSGAVPVNAEHLTFDAEDFNHLYAGYQPTEHIDTIVDVWRGGWDDSIGACPPERVTDAALEHRDESQLVVHYQQPHAPYIGRRDGSGRDLGYSDSHNAQPARGDPTDKPIWERVKSGATTEAELWEYYRANMDRVLGEVATLLQEVGGDFDNVGLTADHGEALGEYGVYMHPRFPSHPHVRTVPWVSDPALTAEGIATARSLDHGTETDEQGARVTPDDVEHRLAALGYR